MEDEDRKKLIINCDVLVKQINWSKIWQKLIDHGVYRTEDKNVQKWKENLNDIDNNRDIYLGIINRGPKAFNSFIRCLKEIGRNDLANILRPTNNSIDQVDNTNKEEADVVPEFNGNNNLERNGESIEEVEQIEGEEEEGEEEEEEKEEHGDEIIDDYYTRLQLIDTPLKIRVKKSTKFMDNLPDGVPCYTMRSKPRGLVLIINNILFGGIEADDRSATEHDENNLKDLFEQMGFDVEIRRNLKRQEMLDRIQTFSKQPELRRVHSLFVIVMSHGNEHVSDNRAQSVVCGVDNLFITDSEVLDFFTATNCENMYNKPKVFIFQTCRGEKVQQAISPSNVSMGRDDTDTNPFVSSTSQIPPSGRNYSDMLVAYSTLPGHKAHRDKFTGSWYIQTLCEVLMNHAHNKELYRMLQMADQRLSRMQTGGNGCQTSTTTSWGFNKKCYLNPGYFRN